MCIFGNPHHSEELNTLPTYVELPLLQTVVCCQRIKEEMSMEQFSSVSLIDYSFEPFTRAERLVEAEVRSSACRPYRMDEADASIQSTPILVANL
jgi:hypothetical protein